MLAHIKIEAALADAIDAQGVPTRAFWRDGADEGRVGVFLVANPPADGAGSASRELEVMAVCRGDNAAELTEAYEALVIGLVGFVPPGEVCYGGHSILQGVTGFDETANTLYCDITILFTVGAASWA